MFIAAGIHDYNTGLTITLMQASSLDAQNVEVQCMNKQCMPHVSAPRKVTSSANWQ